MYNYITAYNKLFYLLLYRKSSIISITEKESFVKNRSKIIAFILFVFVFACCLSSFVGCSTEKDAKIELNIEINGVQIEKLNEKDSSSWYADIELKENDNVKITQTKNIVYQKNITESGKYTVVANKNEKNFDVEIRKQKKGIIWVTALLSGGLYDFENQQNAWDPLPYEDVRLNDFLDPETSNAFIGNLVAKLLVGDPDYPNFKLENLLNPLMLNSQNSSNMLWNVGLDNYGKPYNSAVTVDNDGASRAKYGVLNAYRPHYEDIYELYDGDIDFHIFNYDWRLDCRDGAKKLEEYIEQNKFTDILLFSHSMGANVVASYLANSEYNRSRISKYVSIGGSFLGSFDVLYTMEDMESYFNTVSSSLGLDALLDGMPSFIKTIINSLNLKKVLGNVQTFVSNLDSFVQLLPSFDLISGKQYGENGDGKAFTIDGVEITDEDSLYEFYESRPWAWQKDENNEYVMDENKHVLRDIVKDLKNFHYSSYVTLDDGTKVHSTTLVDTVYVLGGNVTSFCGADLNTEDNKLTFRTTQNGDLQVLFYSGIVNLDENKLRENGKLIEIENGNHIEIGCYYKLIKDTFTSQVAEFWGQPSNQNNRSIY